MTSGTISLALCFCTVCEDCLLHFRALRCSPSPDTAYIENLFKLPTSEGTKLQRHEPNIYINGRIFRSTFEPRYEPITPLPMSSRGRKRKAPEEQGVEPRTLADRDQKMQKIEPPSLANELIRDNASERTNDRDKIEISLLGGGNLSLNEDGDGEEGVATDDDHFGNVTSIKVDDGYIESTDVNDEDDVSSFSSSVVEGEDEDDS